ncbi:zinc ABC transporter substrate-binding protein ZnuA [Aggregatibacter kilianii]|jgi:high-affinity zinc uptake system protein znuA|uniref:zinc ABC transporter substrate-binding protein ZnuA n=1 Tax=Aggregatibacter kilianii TaxID=2025884 RepID=UPI000D655C6A|nr:zinc ABC transporter substrate-binding protein ZnuA [Aggregatibacter kilianii]RDE88115.1 zinc ABC transporter substrate-binding protein ZnuA [Aggregatibacter aphrophilus]
MLAQHLKTTAIAAAILSFSAAASATIVTSVKPLGFIASSIANGITDTEVLVPAGASPHDYSLKPSDVQKLKSAEMLIWIGEDVDAFLDKSIDDLDYKKVLTIKDIAAIEPFLLKGEHHHHHHGEGDVHEGHDHAHKGHEHKGHEHAHEGHDHKHEHKHEHGHEGHEHHHDHEHEDLGVNWHVWYSPDISKAVAQRIAAKLLKQYPEKKDLIEKNVAEFNRTLDEQSAKIKTQLEGVKDKGFYVFHDAYGYFNNAYGLKQTGYFTINPLVAPGAKTLAKIKEEIAEHKVTCLFAEPQFTPKVIESLSKGTKVNVGRLDPMGDAVKLGANSYAAFLQFTADSYAQCLAK